MPAALRDDRPSTARALRLWTAAPKLWAPGRLRDILVALGYRPCPITPFARPKPEDVVAAWGHSPLAPKSAAFAERHGLRLLRLEDAFLRSILPGRAKRRNDGPLGILLDTGGGVHFDPNTPSTLETLLAQHPLDDTALLDRAREGMARLKACEISKYNAHDLALAPPDPGYVLIIDQTREDAAIKASGAGYGAFREMLFQALDDHPHARIVIRTHPETQQGLRQGHFGPEDATEQITVLDSPVAPYALLEGAIAVYTLSSQLGFEAILAGHRPKVFGRPFYAGWGLSEDLGGPLPRRHRPLTRAQLFAAAMILAPNWFNPATARLCSFEEALDQLEAELRAYREDAQGYAAAHMRLWKRGAISQFYGAECGLRFASSLAKAESLAKRDGRRAMAWATAPEAEAHDGALLRIEDGFLRSRGLGADLVAPLSLISDPEGIYYDARRPSRLDRLIATPRRTGELRRAEALIATLSRQGVTKYNLDPAQTLPETPQGQRILVPGQVEDDASLRFGANGLSNLALLQRVRQENPQAVILWKPHPDVEAGLRKGHVPPAALKDLVDVTLTGVDAARSLTLADEVWTLTSTLGFEALLRGKSVTTLGAPFYAGWGLTRDLGEIPPWRRAKVSLPALAYAALIAYPRYRDPISGRPCSAETVTERLAEGRVLPRSLALRLLAKAQGALAGQSWLWRR